MSGSVVAFYAPMKAPDHPTPSGDREIARLTLIALERAGFLPRTVSDLRLLEKAGDRDVQRCLDRAAKNEAARLAGALAADPPQLWYTYHCYYRAPDLLGPRVATALGIPYVISEPSISVRRREGPWAAFARASEAAIRQADRLFWTTSRDRPALEAAGHDRKMVQLPAFVDPGDEPKARSGSGELRFLTVAMMREGDKLESYRRLAAALCALGPEIAGGPGGAPRRWRLDILGDGPARGAVEAAFRPLARQVRFLGATDDRGQIRACYDAADLFLWPGVGEGVGMVYLEAQAAGLPVIAEAHPAPMDLCTGPLVPPDDAAGFAAAVRTAAADLPARRLAARAHVLVRHSISAAAETLRSALWPLVQ